MNADQTYTAVIADDDAAMRLYLRYMLESEEFTIVGEACDGFEAVALIERHHPALVLLDLDMPRLDGLGAIPLILSASPATKILVFSCGDGDAALALGAHGYVDKEVAADTLISLARRLAGDAGQAGSGT